MSDESERILRRLLARRGRTYAEELGIRLERPGPPELFQWLVAAVLFSARINRAIATAAARALFAEGWTTPSRLLAAGWQARTLVLNRAGYARYDGKTSSMLEDDARTLIAEYDGNLENLRRRAGLCPATERALIKRFKGIGDVGADIFFREIQLAWEENYPFLDHRALRAAQALGLPPSARELAGRVGRADFPRLATALVRVALAHEEEAFSRVEA